MVESTSLDEAFPRSRLQDTSATRQKQGVVVISLLEGSQYPIVAEPLKVAGFLPRAIGAGETLHHPALAFVVECPSLSLKEAQEEIRKCRAEFKVLVSRHYSQLWASLAVRAGADFALQAPVFGEELVVLLRGLEKGLGGDAMAGSAPALPTLAKMEWEYITRTLCLFGGNITRAAAALGMSRQNLQRRLRKYGPKG